MAGLSYLNEPTTYNRDDKWWFSHLDTEGIKRFGPFDSEAESEIAKEKYMAEYRDPIWPNMEVKWCK